MCTLPFAGWGEGAGCRCWVSGAAGAAGTRGAAGKEWKREQGRDTPSLPVPQVSPHQGMPPFLCRSKARGQGLALLLHELLRS